jgi:hypothetical protein
MAGAFTHQIICDVAKRRKSILGVDLYKLLNKYSEFLFLGAASPDLPYLSFQTGNVNWADVMHYERTNSTVITGYEEMTLKWPARDAATEIKFIWLMGFASHLVADATIHPVIQAIVGPYDQSDETKEEHRICEITQDSLIFNAFKKNDIYYGEFSSILKFCKDSEHFDDLMEFWNNQILLNYHEKQEEPHPSFWFLTYTSAIDTAEVGSEFVGLFRHLGKVREYVYKTQDEILSNYREDYKKYYGEVVLPDGSKGLFKTKGFQRAVSNVVTVWSSLFDGLTNDIIVTDIVKNWNLDTGIDQGSTEDEVTYWKG